MTNEEHAARAMLMGLWFDAAIRAYRPRSPEGSKYKYTSCLDADYLEPLGVGDAMRRERDKGISNTVSRRRLGVVPW